MKLSEAAELSGFSVDQARRRLNQLAREGVIKRRHLPEEQNRWDYTDKAVEVLKQLMYYEQDLGLTSKAGIIRLAVEHGGRTDPQLSLIHI